MAKYAVIGAGWAGCSAAVELAKKGHQVELFEAARTLGGRARQWHYDGLTLDNGQHILLGAYRDTLALLRTIGVNPDAALMRLPLQMCYPRDVQGAYTLGTGMEFIAPKLPAPFHVLVALLRANGIRREDKMALARFSSTVRWMDWHLHTDCSVAELLVRFDQTDHLIRLLWQPLCVAALNTPIASASAQVFLNVLKESLGARRAASDMLIPRCDLSSLLPDPATAYIVARGGNVHLGCAIQSITLIHPTQKDETDIVSSPQWQLHSAQDALRVDGVVIATPAKVAASLLEPLTPHHGIPEYSYEPITTCYLRYPASVRLERPFFALLDQPEHNQFGQFVFDRGQFNSDQGTANQAGLLAVIVSASQAATAQGHAQLAQALAHQLATTFHRPELMQAQWSQVITEKRASFACTPNLQRPDQHLNISGLEGISLAGDYTASPYPATLESAVASGIHAASALLR